MNKKPVLFSAISFLILSATIGLASAQSSKEAEGQTAERAGKLREALTHYVTALQSVSEGSADDQRLRETIIRLVQKLSPPPAIPEEAERRMARGRAAVKAATDEQGFVRAANEFSAAVKAAPWLADGYFNLGVVLDKAGKHADAIRNLKLYMLAAPNAPDAKQVRDLMFEIEYRQEEAKRTQAREAEKAQQEAYVKQQRANLSGRWMERHNPYWAPGVSNGYDVTTTGNNIRIRWVEYSGQSVQNYNGQHWFEGTINGKTLSGTYSIDLSMWIGGRVFTYPFSGTLNEAGNVMVLKHRSIRITGARGRVPDGWSEYENELVLEKK